MHSIYTIAVIMSAYIPFTMSKRHAMLMLTDMCLRTAASVLPAVHRQLACTPQLQGWTLRPWDPDSATVEF